MPGLMTGAEQPENRQQQRDKNTVGPLRPHFEIRHSVSGADEEQQRHHRQHRPRQRIKAKPSARRDQRRIHEQPKHQHDMHETNDRQQPGSSSVARPEGRQGRSHQGHDNEEEGFHSRSVVSLRVSSESKARWMRSMMMPMTNTPTVTSSRMPDSTSNGIEWMSKRPKSKMP